MKETLKNIKIKKGQSSLEYFHTNNQHKGSLAYAEKILSKGLFNDPNQSYTSIDMINNRSRINIKNKIKEGLLRFNSVDASNRRFSPKAGETDKLPLLNANTYHSEMKTQRKGVVQNIINSSLSPDMDRNYKSLISQEPQSQNKVSREKIANKSKIFVLDKKKQNYRNLHSEIDYNDSKAILQNIKLSFK